MIGTKCKECGKSYRLKDTAAGKSINCECGSVVAVPAVPNLDENGERIRVAKNEQENKSAKPETLSERKIKSIADKRDRLPDLSAKKICSKCKNIFNMEIKECPKCGFNSMGIKYDQTRREEISRKVSQKIYHIGKYVIPGLILIFMIIFFNAQMSVLEDLRKLDKKVVQTIRAEQAKLAEYHKTDSKGDLIMNYFLVDKVDMPFFIAVPKKNDQVKFSFFGNGFFTLKTPGICYEIKYSKGNRRVKRHYIEDEKGNLLDINLREFDIYSFESFAYKIVGF